MWYKLAKIKSLPSGQLYFDGENKTPKINPEEYFDIQYDYDNTTDISNELISKNEFDLDRHYPYASDKNVHSLIIKAVNKMNSEIAAKMNIIFPFSHPHVAIIDDVRVSPKSSFRELKKSWGDDLSLEDLTYAKNGLGQFLYHKAIEWIKNNKPEVKFVTGYISSKESYNSRIKSLGDPSYIRPRDSRKPGNYKHEEIVESLPPSKFTTQGGSYDYDNQVEVRHDIKD